MTKSAVSLMISLAILSCQCPAGTDSCGTVPPRGISISTDASNAVSILSIRRGALTADLQFAGAMTAVNQVCQLPSGRLVVFGDTGAGSSNIQIVDVNTGRVADSFGAYTPVLSPDEHWIAYRRFYPAQTVSPSEEYLLYDLTKTARQNRAGFKAEDMDAPGVLVYPVVASQKPFDDVSLPPSQTHSFRGRSFYWAADSGAFTFADSVEQKLSLILVTAPSGAATTYYQVADTITWDSAAPRSLPVRGLTLLEARVLTAAGQVRDVSADFGAGGCPPIQIPFSVFRPAPPEIPIQWSRGGKPSVEAPRQ